ncbi:phage head morphogenesis protein [Ignatzschineria rhizosphaerae]|uniref:Phage head morphogenesis protein n=1 Tax=Ignatzschineria rhizosphaerae TaxID=2923279 RepID=A0ABY3X1N0_9GAMM|nr:phage minor head protein [Ignatzschineria rhizosphaerae]UNM95676.1 phage head morphogenesis protein [Ignatzschineria rhizosphaerae]
MPTPSVSKVDVMAAMRMEPKKALEYFRNLGIPVDDKFATQALMRARSRAFTIANINSAKITDHIYKEILSTIEAGQTPDFFLKNIRESLKAKGWLSNDLPAYRLKQMMRSNMQTAFNAGRFQSQKANIDRQPWWIRIEVDDERTRPSHVAMHKVAARADDPFWDNNYPPFLDGEYEYGCRGRVRAVSDKRFQEMLKNDKDIKVIESNGSSGQSVMDDEDQIKEDGIKQIDNTDIQDQLRKKLYG